MFANYLKITLRNLWGSKLYSAINLLGLATGLTATLLIGLFVLDELGYDRHYADAERIYRVSREFPPQNIYLAANAPQVAALLKADFPEIEQAARVLGESLLLSSEDKAFYEANVRFADNEFFDIFALSWITGDSTQALARPFTIVLTESLAMKYFGSVDVLGRSLTLENAVPLEVTGVIRDLPHNTHLDLGVVVSMATIGQMLGEGFFDEWGSNSFHTYIRLRPGVAIDTVTARFPDFMRSHIAADAMEWTGMTAFALGDIHLHSGRQDEMKAPGSIGTIYAFTAAALFILLIACCNFMNLSTARSARRGREVGIRKSLGASRVELARQFVGESLLLTLFAMGLALVFAELMLPIFNALIGKELRLVINLRTLAALLGLVVTVGLVAGSYPAFFLSAFKPAQVLRSLLGSGGGAALRNTLVVLQFTIAIVLVVATLVVSLQLRYARDIDTGFSREQVVVLTGSPTAGLGPQWETLRERLASHPGVSSVTSSAQTPFEINTNAANVRAEGEERGRAMPFMRVDYDFFATYEIPLLAGREFSDAFPTDRLVNGTDGAGLVLNRLAVEQYGWTPDEAIGKQLRVAQNGGATVGTVVGVVENSYFESVRANLKPMLFLMPEYITNGEAQMHKASIRLSGANLQDTLAHIDATWTEFMPDFPLARAFLDDRLTALFRAESQQGEVFRYFALLGVVIACLGLYGLASYNAERRTKEIGVRKVMGGSVWSIVLLLTNDFSRLVLIANVIAWPIAYVAMDRWLENFAYRIDLTPLVFIGSGAIALCIAWVTVGGTAAKAAAQKPVLALRYE